MGELSHDYLHSAEAAMRIANHLPGVRLITTLRNPVDRAFSEYLFLIRNGWTKLPFEKAIEKWPELIEKGLYFRHLSTYYQLFERSQIGVFFFNDFISDPENFAKAIFDFLGIPFSNRIDYNKRVLPASKPRNFVVARLIKITAKLARCIFR
ncbi:MAG: sulfotransferase domain-containing protein [Chloroflexota bacterium]